MHTRRGVVLLLLALTASPSMMAQAVEEPPIPVTIICPYHEDSLRRAYEAGLAGTQPGQAAFLDSVRRDLVRSNQDLTSSVQSAFVLVYLLLGIMALMTIAALRTAHRLRSELQQDRDERRIMPLALPPPTMVDSVPIEITENRHTTTVRKKRPKPRSRGKRTATKRR
jgi:hypothetical protein